MQIQVERDCFRQIECRGDFTSISPKKPETGIVSDTHVTRPSLTTFHITVISFTKHKEKPQLL
jgi:hypothetical protein